MDRSKSTLQRGTGVQVEQDGRDVSGGVVRSQNAVFVMTHDWSSIAQFLGPQLERVDQTAQDIQLLVIASDADRATAVAATAVALAGSRDINVVAATSARRASRLIRVRTPHVVTGTPDTLVDLVRGAAIKLDAVRMICVAWMDELIAQGALESHSKR